MPRWGRAVAEHERRAGSVTDPVPAERPIAGSDRNDGGPAASWWRRRGWAWILGGAVVALILIAGQVVWMSQLLAQESTPTETSTAEIPSVPNEFPQGLYLPAPDYALAQQSVGADADRAQRPARHS